MAHGDHISYAALLAIADGGSAPRGRVEPFGDIINRPGPEMGHRRDSLLMGDYYGSAMGDIGDLLGDDDMGDYDMGDDDGMGEMGRKRRKLKRLNRLAKKQGLAVVPRDMLRAAQEEQQASALAREAAVTQTDISGIPTTARGRLAISNQRELMLPFATAALAITLGATQVITTNVQRAIQLRRFLMTATDNTAFTDASLTVGVSLIKIGSEIVFNANGVVPLSAFAANAWGVDLMCQPAQTGNLVEITVVRIVATANTSTIAATGYGFSAGAR